MTEGAAATAIECLDNTLDVVDQAEKEQQQHHEQEGTTILELNLLKGHESGEEQQVVKMTQNKVSL